MTETLIQTVRRLAYDVNRDLDREAMMEKYDVETMGVMVCRIVEQGRVGLSTAC